MGYFDALTSGYFKVAPDGRRLFFPWGVLGRGYAVASEEDYERLRQRLKVYSIVSLIVVVVTAGFQLYVAAVVTGAALMVFYAVWSRSLLAGLQPTQERLSLRESWSTQARVFSASALWSLEIVALAFVVCGLFLLVVDPDSWAIAAGCMAFFGACAAVFAYMIVVRRRARSTGRETTRQ